MTDGLTLVGLGLVLEDADLLVAALFDDFAVDGGAFDVGRSDLGGFASNEKNLADANVLLGFGIDLFDVDLVTDLDFDLLSASFDNCVHGFSSLLLY